VAIGSSARSAGLGEASRPVLVFYYHATEGYPRGGEFVGRVSPRSGTQRCKRTQGLDRFGPLRA
jgi:hypothetical protein